MREDFLDDVCESGKRSRIGMAPKETLRGMLLATGRSEEVISAGVVVVEEAIVL